MRQFTPRQPILDLQITAQEWKRDPEMSLKHDDFYARAWECEKEQLILDGKNAITTHPNSPEIPMQPDLPTEETWNTPKTAQECSQENFSSNGRIM